MRSNALLADKTDLVTTSVTPAYEENADILMTKVSDMDALHASVIVPTITKIILITRTVHSCAADTTGGHE